MTTADAVHDLSRSMFFGALIISTFWLFAKKHHGAGLASLAFLILLILQVAEKKP